MQGVRRTTGMKRSMQDRAQPLLQAPIQFKGVQCIPLGPKFAFVRGVHIRAAQQTLAWRQWFVVSAFDLCPLTGLCLQFRRRQEVIVQRLPALSVEGVDWLHKLRLTQPIASKQLPHMRPVLLLHVTIVVFLVRPRASEPNRLWALLKIAQQVPSGGDRQLFKVAGTKWRGQAIA